MRTYNLFDLTRLLWARKNRQPLVADQYLPGAFAESVSDEEVIRTIRSVPMHFSGSPPSVTTRTNPTGMPSSYKLPEGFSILITFHNQPAIKFWEQEVTPPGIDMGEPINVSTQFNSAYMTKWPRVLKEITDTETTAAYDPDVMSLIPGMAGANDQVTVKFPDGTTCAFWGYLRSFKFQALKIGALPLVNIMITATNQDNNQFEEGPVWTPAAGT